MDAPYAGGEVAPRRMRYNDSFESVLTAGGLFRRAADRASRGSANSLLDYAAAANNLSLGNLPHIASYNALLGLDTAQSQGQGQGQNQYQGQNQGHSQSQGQNQGQANAYLAMQASPLDRRTPAPGRSPTAADIPRYNFSFSDLLMSAGEAPHNSSPSDWFAAVTAPAALELSPESDPHVSCEQDLPVGLRDSAAIDPSVYSQSDEVERLEVQQPVLSMVESHLDAFAPNKAVALGRRDSALGVVVVPLEASHDNSVLPKSVPQKAHSWGEESSHPKRVIPATPKVKKTAFADSPLTADPPTQGARTPGGPVSGGSAAKKPRKRHQKALNRLREQIIMLQSRSMVATQLSRVHASEHAFLKAENTRLAEENRAFKQYIDARLQGEPDLADKLNELSPVPCGIPMCLHDKLPVKPYGKTSE
mmetsp:Transcript_2292/g.6207  ORF Transcript_2292/g.6207 Transcript_2292/m.6207 type:complete len:420 (-) Transcript_2292:180-1439(-)